MRNSKIGALLGGRQRLLGHPLRGDEIAPLQREACEYPQVIHGEEMPLETEPVRRGLGGLSGLGGFGKAPGLPP